MRSCLVLFIVVVLAACGDRSSAPLVSTDAPPRDDANCVADAQSAPRTTKFWIVRPGDSLRRIARRVYGDENLWKAIRDANPASVGRDGAIVVGATLEIPFDGI